MPALLSTDSEGFYVLHEPDGRVTRHYAEHGLRRIRSLVDGRTISINYDAFGRPSSVRDSLQAWQWNIATDPVTERITGITVDGRPDLGWQYVYSDDDLTSVVSVSNATWRTYEYDPVLVSVRDPLGNLIESHTFDGNQAQSDTSSGAEIVSVIYDQPGRVDGERYTATVSATGETTRYYTRPIVGTRRVVEVSGTCNCGTSDVVYAHGARGQIVRQQDARGYITEHTYSVDGTVRTASRTAPAANGL